MPKDKPLRVYANPWHAPLDHNHRANCAVPWDPNHNPDRGFVGAALRLDGEGERYFEFAQFDHELNVKSDAEPVEIPEWAVNERGERHRSIHYIQAIRHGALLAADEDTHVRCGGLNKGFLDPKKRLEQERTARHAQHELDHDEKPEPKARPKCGDGRVGAEDVHRTLSACVLPSSAGSDPRSLLQQFIEKSAKTAKVDAKLAATSGNKDGG